MIALVVTMGFWPALLAAPADGQAPPRPTIVELRALFGPPVPAVGLRGGFDFAVDAWSVGAQASVPVGGRDRILLMPSADLFLRRYRADWQLNADIAAGLGPLRLFHAGLGLGVLNREPVPGDDAETRATLNFFGGLEFPGVRTATRPFLQLRWTVGEAAPFQVLAGLNYRLSGR